MNWQSWNWQSCETVPSHEQLKRVVYLLRLHYMHGAPLELLGLSVRAANALHRAQCTTVGDVFRLPMDRFAIERGAGCGIIREVRHALDVLRQTCRDG